MARVEEGPIGGGNMGEMVVVERELIPTSGGERKLEAAVREKGEEGGKRKGEGGEGRPWVVSGDSGRRCGSGGRWC